MFQVGIPFRNVQRPENKRDIFGLITDLLNSIGNEQFFVATIDKTAFFFFSAEITKHHFSTILKKDDVVKSLIGLNNIIN